MPRETRPEMEIALSPRNSPTAHHAKARIVWFPRLGAFLADFLIPFLRQPPPTPQSPIVEMAQERTGIVVGTNSGRVRYPYPFQHCRVGSLFFCRSENFRFSRVVGSGSNVAGDVCRVDEQVVREDCRKMETFRLVRKSSCGKFGCSMNQGAKTFYFDPLDPDIDLSRHDFTS